MSTNKELSASSHRSAPGGGRSRYLLEEDYFFDVKQPSVRRDMAFFGQAVRITARCVARWADRYLARPCSHRDLVRQGEMPANMVEREALIDDLFDWLTALPGPLSGDVLNLYQGDTVLLEQGDGMASGTLTITDTQFTELQGCWGAHDLPRDLYYPASDERTAVDPVEKFGGIVRVQQRYSPRRWERRIQTALDAVPVPSEAERVASFLTALSTFQQALWLRRAQLVEPGRTHDPSLTEERKGITDLDQAVLRVALRIKAREARPSNAPHQQHREELHEPTDDDGMNND